MRLALLRFTLFVGLFGVNVLPALALEPLPENTAQCCYNIVHQLPVTEDCSALDLNQKFCSADEMSYTNAIQPLSTWQLFWKQGLSVGIIGITCLVLLGTALLVKVLTKYRLKPFDYAISVLIGLALTGGSLVYQAKRFSGDGQIEQFGWPHFFYFMYYNRNNVIQDQGINVGPFGSYLIMNILFYSLLTLLIVIVVRAVKRKKATRYL